MQGENSTVTVQAATVPARSTVRSRRPRKRGDKATYRALDKGKHISPNPMSAPNSPGHTVSGVPDKYTASLQSDNIQNYSTSRTASNMNESSYTMVPVGSTVHCHLPREPIVDPTDSALKLGAHIPSQLRSTLDSMWHTLLDIPNSSITSPLSANMHNEILTNTTTDASTVYPPPTVQHLQPHQRVQKILTSQNEETQVHAMPAVEGGNTPVTINSKCNIQDLHAVLKKFRQSQKQLDMLNDNINQHLAMKKRVLKRRQFYFASLDNPLCSATKQGV